MRWHQKRGVVLPAMTRQVWRGVVIHLQALLARWAPRLGQVVRTRQRCWPCLVLRVQHSQRMHTPVVGSRTGSYHRRMSSGRCVDTRVTPPRHPRVHARVRRMARSPRAHTGLLAAFTGVRVSTTRPPRGTSIWIMPLTPSTPRPPRCGFVRSGLLSPSSLHLFITFAFSFWFFAFRSKGRSAGRCCAGGLVCGLGPVGRTPHSFPLREKVVFVARNQVKVNVLLGNLL